MALLVGFLASFGAMGMNMLAKMDMVFWVLIVAAIVVGAIVYFVHRSYKSTEEDEGEDEDDMYE